MSETSQPGDEHVEAERARDHEERLSAASSSPVLLVLPDPELRSSRARDSLLAKPLAEWMWGAASYAGFSDVLVAPGLRGLPSRRREVAHSDLIECPALVVFEGTYIHPKLLRLMVEHPLEEDERFTLYDRAGRPSALFSGHLKSVPSMMPMAEELDFPHGFGPQHLARVVYDEDCEACEQLIVDSVCGEHRGAWWVKKIRLSLLRFFSKKKASVAQLELFALVAVLFSGPLILLPFSGSLFLGALLLLVGVTMAGLSPALRILLSEHESPFAFLDEGISKAKDKVVRAMQPLGHASFLFASTYQMALGLSGARVAGLLPLLAGLGASALSLLHARSLLREEEESPFALPQGKGFFERFGFSLPTWTKGLPVPELVICVLAVSGELALPWIALCVVAFSRLWRWFVRPAKVDKNQA